MQAVVFIAIFSLALSILMGLAAGYGPSTKQLIGTQVEETKKYFKDVQTVIRDTTRNNLEAAPATVTDIVPYMQSNQNIAQLSLGRWGDPTLDIWGNPVKGFVVRAEGSLYAGPAGTGDIVSSTISGIVLLSAGPDRVFQTTLPKSKTFTAIYGAAVPLGSDDILTVFTDEVEQRQNWEDMVTQMNRLASALLSEYQSRLTAYKNDVEAQRQQEIATNGYSSITLENKLLTDPNAPNFIDVTTPANRKPLGSDEDFALLERTWGNGGRMKVISVVGTAAESSMTLRLVNDPVNPTVWGSPPSKLQYSINIKGKL